MTKESVGPTSYEIIPAYDFTNNRAQRPIFGSEKPVSFTDYATKISCSPGPSLRAPKVAALDLIVRTSPREKRERLT